MLLSRCCDMSYFQQRVSCVMSWIFDVDNLANIRNC